MSQTVPGLNGIHTWKGLVAINDLANWPRVKLINISGLQTLPELSDSRDMPAGRAGEIPRRSLRRGKSLVYSGRLEARSQAELDDFRFQLMSAFGDSTDEGRMDITPMTGFTNPAMYYTARVMALDIPEEQPEKAALKRRTFGYERGFTLGVRLSDARFYEAATKNSVTAALLPVGGLPLPWTLPVSIPAPGASSGAAVCTNDGNAPTEFVADMYGPGQDMGLINSTLGVAVWLKNLQLGATDFVRIDSKQRTLKLNGIADVRYALDRDRTSWWDGDTPGLAKGINNLQIQGLNVIDPAHASITFSDAQWG